MSILIKGMEMPELFCGADIVLYEGINGSAVPRKYKISAKQAVSVPPHGRLIDADALIVDKGIDTYAAVFAIAIAPAIIPADEEGDKDA